jgi:membrane-bound lytic murein transglycosylase
MKMMSGNRNATFGSALLLAAVVVLGSVGLVACGGGGQGTAQETAATPTPTTEQAQQEQALAARQQRLSEAKSGISQIQTSAGRLPMKDEQLDSMLSQLDSAAAKAEQSLSSDQADTELSKIEQLSKEASSRLATLQQQEQEARQQLEQRYEKVVANGKQPPAGVVWGLNGELYLKYKDSAVQEAQQELKNQGYYDGPINGELDEATQVALGRFQEVHKLPVTGIPTPYTRSELAGEGHPTGQPQMQRTAS